MEPHSRFREQFAIFQGKLEVFRSLKQRNAAISNELYDIFAEVNAIKESSHLLRAWADKRIVELRLSEPLIGAEGTQDQILRKNAETT